MVSTEFVTQKGRNGRDRQYRRVSKTKGRANGGRGEGWMKPIFKNDNRKRLFSLLFSTLLYKFQTFPKTLCVSVCDMYVCSICILSVNHCSIIRIFYAERLKASSNFILKILSPGRGGIEPEYNLRPLPAKYMYKLPDSLTIGLWFPLYIRVGGGVEGGVRRIEKR
jgi:hypothetical protein